MMVELLNFTVFNGDLIPSLDPVLNTQIEFGTLVPVTLGAQGNITLPLPIWYLKRAIDVGLIFFFFFFFWGLFSDLFNL